MTTAAKRRDCGPNLLLFIGLLRAAHEINREQERDAPLSIEKRPRDLLPLYSISKLSRGKLLKWTRNIYYF